MMSGVGAQTKKVNTYGRKKTQIVTIHTDFTPFKNTAFDPICISSSEDESPKPRRVRPPLSTKITQDIVAQSQNIPSRPTDDSAKTMKGLVEAKGKQADDMKNNKPKAGARRAPRKAATQQKVSRMGSVIRSERSKTPEMADCIKAAVTSPPASTCNDPVADLATQLFGLDVDSPSRAMTVPAFLEDRDPIESLLSVAGHPAILPFGDLLSSQALRNVLPGRAKITVKKIGEASYSEVFALKRGKEEIVVKIVPLLSTSQTSRPGGEDEYPDCSHPADVLREVEITKTMSGLKGGGFIGFKGVYVVEGKYSSALLDQWQLYEEEHGTSSVSPKAFTAEQKYALFILEDGGVDLESWSFDKSSGWLQASSVFWQVVDALARAEDETSFEHRDLHEGQILISRGSSCCDLRATIIDFGLSRLYSQDERVIWSKLPEEVYEGVGEQWDVYRAMKDELDGDWEGYHSITNVMWLRYLARYLLHSKDMTKPATLTSMRIPSSPLRTRRVPLARPTVSVDPVAKKNAVAYASLKNVEKALSDSLKNGKGVLTSAQDVLDCGRLRGWTS